MEIYCYDKKGIFLEKLEAKKDPLENERRLKFYQEELTIINRMKGLDDGDKAGLIAKLKTPEDAFLVPANATKKKPPKLAKNEVACFNHGKWLKLKDHRGQLFHIPGEKEEFRMDTFGDFPEGAVLGKRPISDGEKWEAIRAERDNLLRASDWMMLPDSPRIHDKSAIDYRQALRDLPSKFSDAKKVVFPKMV